MTGRRDTGALVASPLLVGAVTLLVAVVAIFIAYTANRGLPFIPTYDISVTVPDGSGLGKGREVRVAGKRIGTIERVEAASRPGGPPVARLSLELERQVKPIRTDTVVRVRPLSPLGSKYLELDPGRRGRALEPGQGLPLANARPTVDLTESFDLFDARTRRSLQEVYEGFGEGFAGRGEGLNELVADSPRLLGRLDRVGRELSRPATRLDRFVSGAERTASELGAARRELGPLVEGADTTAGALDAARSELADSVSELPSTEEAGRRALAAARPALRDAEVFVRDIRPGLAVLEPASRQLHAALREGIPVLRRATGLAPLLSDALAAVDRLARDPATPATLAKLRLAVRSLRPTLAFVAPSQTVCNYAALSGLNFSSALSEGDASGTWLRTMLIQGRETESVPRAAPVDGLHVNPYAGTGQNGRCEAGNEPFLPGTRIGPVAGGGR